MLVFHKYHALGNDYLVLDNRHLAEAPSPAWIQRVCDRNFGLGSDGILFGPHPRPGDAFHLRIFNPDGGEAEKSGNGLRIFARFLFDQKMVSDQPFAVQTQGGRVTCQVRQGGAEIEVDMGRASFNSADIPVAGPPREVLREKIDLLGHPWTFSCATVGNPHCVVEVDQPSEELARQLGPLLERHPLFPNRTNVQLLRVIDRRRIHIHIWERGAGYTLASGSSSCAAGAVARRLGWVDDDLTVEMAGGSLSLRFDPAGHIHMTGPATRVGTFTLDPEAVAGLPGPQAS